MLLVTEGLIRVRFELAPPRAKAWDGVVFARRAIVAQLVASFLHLLARPLALLPRASVRVRVRVRVGLGLGLGLELGLGLGLGLGL